MDEGAEKLTLELICLAGECIGASGGGGRFVPEVSS